MKCQSQHKKIATAEQHNIMLTAVNARRNDQLVVIFDSIKIKDLSDKPY